MELAIDDKEVLLQQVTKGDESYYRISNVDKMRPFFMSIVSHSDHWMFISSNGGLTAGRKNSDFSLFPYYTDDKIHESNEVTGSKSIFWITKDGQKKLWEPFSNRQFGLYNVTRNIYKSLSGNKILFEEINHDLELEFSYEWNSSDTYGFIRKSRLKNNSEQKISIDLIDGIQNIVPFGVKADVQSASSNLVDAYKRSELHKGSGLGIYALSSIIVDRAEPSEALKANVAWSHGLNNPKHLVSSLQLDNFRKGNGVRNEDDIKAEKGAYFLNSIIELNPESEKEWMIIANTNQDSSAVIDLIQFIKSSDNIKKKIEDDIAHGDYELLDLISSSDGIQLTADQRSNARHFSNTLFNIMRGGIFDQDYKIEKEDFCEYLESANKKVYENSSDFISILKNVFTVQELRSSLNDSTHPDLSRLAMEYLPLKFSRRHGDPSRPWNKFSINIKDENDGSKILDYEGNWRDIFQNWEALAYSFPEFIDGMIFKFLNASTFDGYNPYRVTKGGIDWEVIEEHDPWSYIGYWGDHQIIYLLKFLEFIENFYPGKLAGYMGDEIFAYANVPYRIKSYAEILKDPKDTIVFDYDLDEKIREERGELGADAALLKNQSNDIHRVNLLEKLLATTLSKLSNFIPEAGIWMNTQRPEWNDANNALVGNGVSMVTLCYLRRFLEFFKSLLEENQAKNVKISVELLEFFNSIFDAFKAHQDKLKNGFNPKDKKLIMDDLGGAGSVFREKIYAQSFSDEKESIETSKLLEFCLIAIDYTEQTIASNKREDGMYHAYNLMSLKNESEVEISYLDEMLEGQVAVLSSKFLSAEESLSVLDSMKSSALFRPDQYSYLLYPEKELPRFLEKNNIDEDLVNSSPLMLKLLKDGNTDLIEKDVLGNYHFNGNFNNANSVKEALNHLSNEGYKELVNQDRQNVLDIFEKVFNHLAFTGRSGTFYGYEGLGSIYWHMVSKLLLAVQESALDAINNEADESVVGKLLDHYYEINAGIGVHKSPELYGAFPTDPYSHTPSGRGAQQPGMTGQVKEDILSRIGELGVVVEKGRLMFKPHLLRKGEFLESNNTFKMIDLNRHERSFSLDKNCLAFSCCQVPVIYKMCDDEKIVINFSDGTNNIINSNSLNKDQSKMIFERAGSIDHLIVHLNSSQLK